MDVDEAVEAVAAIQPQKVVPVHYNYREGIEADPFEFKKKVEGTSGSEVLIL